MSEDRGNASQARAIANARDRLIEDAAKELEEQGLFHGAERKDIVRFVLSTPSVAEQLDRADLTNQANKVVNAIEESRRKAEAQLAQAEAVIEAGKGLRGLVASHTDAAKAFDVAYDAYIKERVAHDATEGRGGESRTGGEAVSWDGRLDDAIRDILEYFEVDPDAKKPWSKVDGQDGEWRLLDALHDTFASFAQEYAQRFGEKP